MSQPPSTPVKVPSSAANYTPATLDPDLRSQINTLLIREGHINKIQERLLHSLDSHNSNWPTAIQAHALSLLRSGEVSTFPALIKRVLEDVRHETATAASSSSSSSNPSSSSGSGGGDNVDGPSSTNGTAAVATNGTKSANGTANGVTGGGDGAGNSLAVPSAVVEAVLKVTRESLEAVCEIDNSGGSSGGGG